MYRYKVVFSEPETLTKRHDEYFHSLNEIEEFFLMTPHLKEKVVSIEKVGRFSYEC